MLADAEAGRAGGNGFKFTADFPGSLRLQIEGLVLGQTAREKNINNGPGAWSGRSSSGECAEGGELRQAQAKQPDGAHLEGAAAGDSRPRVDVAAAGGELAHGAGNIEPRRAGALPPDTLGI